MRLDRITIGGGHFVLWAAITTGRQPVLHPTQIDPAAAANRNRRNNSHSPLVVDRDGRTLLLFERIWESLLTLSFVRSSDWPVLPNKWMAYVHPLIVLHPLSGMTTCTQGKSLCPGT